MKYKEFNEVNRETFNTLFESKASRDEWITFVAEQINKKPEISAIYQVHADSLERTLKLGVAMLTFLSAGFFSVFSGSWPAIALGIFFLIADILFIIPLVSIHTGRFNTKFLWELNLQNGSEVTIFQDLDLVDGTVFGVNNRGKNMTLNINPEGSNRVIYDVPVAQVFPSLTEWSV